MSINTNITFMHISRFILASNSPSFTLFRRRFLYIHTFFYSKVMCSCRLSICLYDIRRASCERRLHHSHCSVVCADLSRVFVHPRQDIPIVDLSRHAHPYPRRAATIIYRHILLWENSFNLIHIRTHEKNRLDFLRAEPLYVLYIAGKM